MLQGGPPSKQMAYSTGNGSGLGQYNAVHMQQSMNAPPGAFSAPQHSQHLDPASHAQALANGFMKAPRQAQQMPGNANAGAPAPRLSNDATIRQVRVSAHCLYLHRSYVRLWECHH